MGKINPAPGCSRSGALITCQANLAAAGHLQLTNVVRSTASFNGQMRVLPEVEPVGAGDPRLYDNTAGPAFITVSGGVNQPSLYLPLVINK